MACQREEGNPEDMYAVAVKANGSIIVEEACSLLLRCSSMCRVTGSRRASSDLTQRGLELLCTLKFACEKMFVGKTKTLTPSPYPSSTESAKAPLAHGLVKFPAHS